MCLGVEICVTVVDTVNDVRDNTCDIHEYSVEEVCVVANDPGLTADVKIDDSCVKADSVCECTD